MLQIDRIYLELKFIRVFCHRMKRDGAFVSGN